MKYRLTALAVLLALASAFIFAPFSAMASTKDKHALKNIPVTGSLPNGGTFQGKVTITQFGYDQAAGLWVSGVLKGTATSADGVQHQHISQSFSQVHTTLSSGASTASHTYTASSVVAQAACDILNLDIGAIHLDLLGLVVDLAPIHLDITAVPGAGNLLGNLLCAVAGLLDPNGLLTDLIGNLTALLNLLNQINQVIG